MQCTECRFFHNQHKQCRRHAPAPQSGGKDAVWPTVAETDWCGEFVADEKAAAKRAA